MFKVQKAKRQKLKAVVGFIGPSGSGKTAGSLLTAYGMMKEKYPEETDAFIWEKVGVADTEHGRSLLYANMDFNDVRIGEFQHIDFEPPFSTERYNGAVKALKDAGCEVIVIDSLSHNWQGEGGIVETHANMTGNSFQNWGKLSMETTSLIKTLTRNDVHILATLRTKQDYVVEQNAVGKSVPKKLGLKPVQKDDMEYEFMINFSIDISHKTTTVKDNSRLFEGNEFTLTPEVGKKLYQWLEEGKDVKAEEVKEKQAIIDIIRGLAAEHNGDVESIIQDLEGKANMPMEEMSLKLVNRMHLVILDRLEKMEIEKNIAATDKEVAK